MDLQKSKILLEKINSLHKSMCADARNISVIEKDLMRNYIIQLYEIVLDTPSAAKSTEVPEVEIIKSTPSITLRKQEIPAPKAAEPELVAQKAPIAGVQEENGYEEETIVRPEIPMKLQQGVSRSVPAAAKTMNPELEDIFNLSSAKELSEKLGQLPISDIKKAMGLNERVFTMNELFGGDQNAFESAMTSLNVFTSFDEAKDFLVMNFADKYNWSEKEKKGKAKNFVKLVKRRYT